MTEGHSSPVRILRQGGTERVERSDLLAVEEPLEIRVCGQSLAVLMRTPGDDAELAIGFLLAEAILPAAGPILDLREFPGDGASGNVVDVRLAHPDPDRLGLLARKVLGGASCGVCGSVTIEQVLRMLPPVRSDTVFESRGLYRLPAALAAHQAAFRHTGGMHASALFSPDGSLLAVREDVGRHNAVDKLAGWSYLAGRQPLHGHGLLLSGRISFELVQKAVACGVPLIAGLGAPSSLAVSCAERAGVTLIGFLRDGGFNLYCGSGRIPPV